MGTEARGALEGRREIVRNGTTVIHCRVYGDGEPIVMIHGWTLHQSMFLPQAATLSRRCRVITYDRRGSGLSAAEPDLAADLQDLNAVITALASGSANVLGMSQGGRLAIRFALSHPERVRKLILQGAALDGFHVDDAPGEEVPMKEYANLVRAGKLAEMRRRWLAHPMMRAGLNTVQGRALVEDIVGDYKGLDLMKFGCQERTPADLQSAVKRLAAPTLLLTGRLETRSRRAHAERLLELLPDAREIELEKSGHLSNFSEPQAYNNAVAGFCCAPAHGAALGSR